MDNCRYRWDYGLNHLAFLNREIAEWRDDVPQRFRGNWRLVEHYFNGNFGVRSIYLPET